MPTFGEEAAPGEITRALHAAQAHEPGAAETLFRLVQHELRARVARLRSGGRRDPCSQTTSVVHDTFLRLDVERTPWRNHDHYFAIATLTAQRLVLDLARRGQRRKRGGAQRALDLDDHLAALLPDPDFLLDLQAAMERLGAMRPRWQQLAELRVFGGLDNHAIAATLGVSLSTVEHDWAFVRAWLHRALGEPA